MLLCCGCRPIQLVVDPCRGRTAGLEANRRWSGREEMPTGSAVVVSSPSTRLSTTAELDVFRSGEARMAGRGVSSGTDPCRCVWGGLCWLLHLLSPFLSFV